MSVSCGGNAVDQSCNRIVIVGYPYLSLDEVNNVAPAVGCVGLPDDTAVLVILDPIHEALAVVMVLELFPGRIGDRILLSKSVVSIVENPFLPVTHLLGLSNQLPQVVVPIAFLYRRSVSRYIVGG